MEAAMEPAREPAMPFRNLIDSHFHLPLIEQPEQVLRQLFEGGFAGGISICVSTDDLVISDALTSSHPRILTARASGPWDTENTSASPKALTEAVEDDIKAHRCGFMGEFGLDYHWDYSTHSRQIELFELQMELAAKLSMPVIIHTRDAAEDTLMLLKACRNPNSGIIHCFSGEADLALQLADLGYYISFAGNITYRKAEKLREALKALPVDRLLLETDSPYLSPVPFRGQPNNPMRMKEIYDFTASLLGISADKLAMQLMSNFKALCDHCPHRV